MVPMTSPACTVILLSTNCEGHGSENPEPPGPPNVGVDPSTAMKGGAPQSAPMRSRAIPAPPYTPTAACPTGHSAENASPFGSVTPVATLLNRAPNVPL